MSEHDDSTLDARIDEAFGPVIDDIAAGAVERERDRRLPVAEVAALRDAGLGALRVPTASEAGGVPGAAVPPPRPPRRSRLEPAAVAARARGVRRDAARPPGERPPDGVAEEARRGSHLVGNAQAERGDTTATSTRLDERDGRLLLNGRKFYSTGTIYADWIWVGARRGDEPVALAVPRRRPRRHADRRLGRLRAAAHRQRHHRVRRRRGRPAAGAAVERQRREPAASYTQGLYQLVLLSALSGIARAVVRDAVGFVRPRTRTFGVPGASSPRDDQLVQRVVGRLSSIASTVEAVTLSAVRGLDAADQAARRGSDGRRADGRDSGGRPADGRRADGRDSGGHDDPYQEALVTVFEAQQTVVPLVLEAASSCSRSAARRPWTPTAARSTGTGATRARCRRTTRPSCASARSATTG
nr:hypothetical protein GCM10025699_77440 [Microbacterium flavescens]